MAVCGKFWFSVERTVSNFNSRRAPLVKGERAKQRLARGFDGTIAKNPSTGKAGPPPFNKGGFAPLNQNLFATCPGRFLLPRQLFCQPLT